jgi:hypothetical protein
MQERRGASIMFPGKIKQIQGRRLNTDNAKRGVIKMQTSMQKKILIDNIINELEHILLKINEIVKPEYTAQVPKAEEQLNRFKEQVDMSSRLGNNTEDDEKVIVKQEIAIHAYKSNLNAKTMALDLLEKARKLKSQGIEYVSSGKEIEAVDLTIPTGYISISSPPGYEIVIDGVFQDGVTPRTISNVPIGQHKITFWRMGWPKYTMFVEVVPDVTAEARL